MSWFQTDKRTFLQKCFGKLLTNGVVPKHVAFIMDGNRRYARNNKIQKIQGHRFGFDKLAETLIWCHAIGIREVTVYAFSIENFKRSKDEVDELFALAKEKFEKLLNEKENVENAQLCIRVFGNLELLPQDLQESIAKVVDMSKNFNRSFLNICCAYTSREEMSLGCVDICKGVRDADINIDPESVSSVSVQFYSRSCNHSSDISEDLIDKCLYTGSSFNVEILYRTSGEVRLSDFLLWQCNTCVLSFINKQWPEFSVWDFYKGIIKYQLNLNMMKQMEQLDSPKTSVNTLEFTGIDENTTKSSNNKFIEKLNLKRYENIENLAKA